MGVWWDYDGIMMVVTWGKKLTWQNRGFVCKCSNIPKFSNLRNLIFPQIEWHEIGSSSIFDQKKLPSKIESQVVPMPASRAYKTQVLCFFFTVIWYHTPIDIRLSSHSNPITIRHFNIAYWKWPIDSCW